MTTNDPTSGQAGANQYSADSVVSSVAGLKTPTPGSGTVPKARTSPASLPGPPRMPQLTLEEVGPNKVRGFSAEHALDEQLQDLERWVQANLKRERNAMVRFWTLRVPSVLCALLAIGCGTLGFPQALPALAGAVALLLAVDAAWPGSTWRGPLRRALYELRQLQNTVKLRWDRVRLAHPDPTSGKRVAYALALLDSIHLKREEISRYLTGFVASPSVGDESL